MFEQAKAISLCVSNPVDSVGALLPNGNHETKHRQALPHGEVAGAIAKVQAAKLRPAVKLCFEFMVLTGCRINEARGAQWSEVDLEAKVWTAPAERMKMKKAHRVPLSGRAIAILAEARKLHDGATIFPARGGGLVADTMFRPGRLLKPLGVECDTHSFRSSLDCWATETGFDRPLVDRALAHAVADRVQAAYNRTDLLEQRRLMMQAWADYLAK